MRKKANKESKLMHYASTLIRVLKKAREFYMKGIEDCAGGLNYGVGVACPAVHIPSRVPASFGSKNSSRASCGEEEWRQLLSRTRNDMHRQTLTRQTSLVGMNHGIGSRKMERIDEDEPCYFYEDDRFFMMANELYLGGISNDLNRGLVY